jgi:pimeloyl-ACP methyl ester carboxylesterase
MCLSWAAVTDGFVNSGPLRLHYQDWGPVGTAGTAGTVVLVHGVGSSCHIWDLTGPLLAEHSLRALALDQRGHGESDQPVSGYDFPSVVADLAGFADGVGIEQPFVLVGHSWGASVVLHFAVAHPDRTAGIVLVDGGTSSPGERWTWEETQSRLTPPEIDGLPWSDLHRRMSRNNGAYVDPRAEAVGRSLFRVDAQGLVSRRFRIPNHMQVVRALWEQRPAELLPQLTCPVLILPARQASETGEAFANKAASVQRALDLQPRARVRWFEDTVHDVPLQRPDELAEELRTFAQGVLAPRARS